MRGLTFAEIVMLTVIMGILAALVAVLAPAPVIHVESNPPPVHIEIKEVKVAQPLTDDSKPRPIHVEIKQVTVEQVAKAAPKPAPKPEPRPFNRFEFENHKLDCLNNVRQLVGLIEANSATKYPNYGGPNLLLYLVKKGDLVGEKRLKALFCPGDNQESFRMVGGVDAYRGLDLGKKGAYGHLTSYAGRDQWDKACRAKKGEMKPLVLVCDDSADHHGGLGMVIGYNGGSAHWRDKVKHWKLPANAPLVVGHTSLVKDLKCLIAG